MNKLSSICYILILLIFLSGCSEQIVPLTNKHLIIKSYTDATGDNGHSIIRCEQKNGIKFEYTLKKGFDYPYAGIFIAPDSGLLDLHEYKYIDIKLSADTACAVIIYLKTVQDSCTIPGQHITYRFNEYTIWVNSIPQTYRINIATMTTPDWWCAVNKKDLRGLGKPDFRKVNNFDIATRSIYLERPGFVHVHKMVLVRNSLPFIIVKNPLLFIFECCVLLMILLTAIWLLIRNNRKRKVISYQQLNNQSLQSKESERIDTYMGSNYANSSLSLEIVGKETGVHWSRVTSIIKKEHNLTFKQYLNTIRIAEAKRLLIETDRQILDIALSVGYGNISHFNRVFKEYEACSPREFRNEKQKKVPF